MNTDSDRSRDDAVRISVEVRGRVQGVGFRFFTRENAESRRVTGWVRNRADGRSVEVEAQGSSEAVEGFLEDLRRGPSMGHVTEVRTNRIPPKENEGGFFVRH